MIDTHIHIVPGVDDGAADMSVSIQMAKMAVSQGIEEMVVTPHYNVPVFTSDQIDQQFQALKAKLKEEGINLKLHLGNEIHVNDASVKGIDTGLARTMGSSHYLLMELSFYQYYPYHEALLYEITLKGYSVVLAHIERYRFFRHDEHLLKELIEKGYYGQMTGRYIAEKKTRKKALKWISEGYVHIVASDAHNTERRPIIMEEAYKVVAKQLGKDCAETIFTLNPKRLIEDQPLEAPTITKHHFWQS